jgi:HEXXH motif-containing protein
MATTDKTLAPAAVVDANQHERIEACTWLERTEQGFHRAASLLKGSCPGRIQDDYRLCRTPEARDAVRAVLVTPSVAFAIADLHMWISETFAIAAAKGSRPNWRQVVDLPGAVVRISRVIERAATAARGEGIVTIDAAPCSLPGLGVRVDQGNGELHLTRDAEVWQTAEGPLPRLDTFEVYGSTVFVDSVAPWIMEPALMFGTARDTRPSSAVWTFGDAIHEAARLIEKALGDAGKQIVTTIHTLVPVDVPGYVINSWTNTVTPGAIYTTRTERPFILAELIVHEAAHLWLSERDYLKRTTSEEHGDVKVYSPFKKKERTAYKVLHGVIAHAWIHRFWHRLRDTESGVHSFISQTRCEQSDRLMQEGLASLQTVKDSISPYGWELYEVSHLR